MNDELFARVKHVAEAIRSGTYVGRDVLQELITDIYDDQATAADPAQLPLVPDSE